MLSIRCRVVVPETENAAVAKADGTLGVGRWRPNILMTPRLGGRGSVAQLIGHYGLFLPAQHMLDEGLPVLVYCLAVLPFAHIVPHGGPKLVCCHSVVVIAEELGGQAVGTRPASVAGLPTVNRTKAANITRVGIHLCVPHDPEHRTRVLGRLLPGCEVGVVDEISVGAVVVLRPTGVCAVLAGRVPLDGDSFAGSPILHLYVPGSLTSLASWTRFLLSA